MIHRVDPVLRDEARRFALVFSCRRCAHFDAADGGCTLGFPNEMHRDVDLDTADEVVFCKAFELG